MIELVALFPPITALSLALVTRNILLSLAAGLFFSEALILQGDILGALTGSIDRAVGVLSNPGDASIIVFCLLVGGLLALMRDSGGIAASVAALVSSGRVTNARRAALTPALTGVLIFIETNVSLLTAGILGRPLFDRFKLSREQLAYIIDSTCSPISVLVLINGWGAYALGLVAPYVEGGAAAGVVAASVPLNFYAIVTVTVAFYTAWTGRMFGPLASVRTVPKSEGTLTPPTHPRFMVVPVLVLLIGTIGFMMWTGDGDILKGDGARSVLYAVCASLAIMLLMLTTSKETKRLKLNETLFAGMGELLPATTIILLSMALGYSLRSLGTGDVLAGLATQFPAPFTLPTFLFLAAAATSFSIGTSWGTYGILIPVAMPLAAGAGLPPSLMLAAVLGGGVFGDHASPISDTTLIASVAAGCDHIDHVRTQLPYALSAALVASVAYLICGFLSLNAVSVIPG